MLSVSSFISCTLFFSFSLSFSLSLSRWRSFASHAAAASLSSAGWPARYDGKQFQIEKILLSAVVCGGQGNMRGASNQHGCLPLPPLRRPHKADVFAAADIYCDSGRSHVSLLFLFLFLSLYCSWWLPFLSSSSFLSRIACNALRTVPLPHLLSTAFFICRIDCLIEKSIR